MMDGALVPIYDGELEIQPAVRDSLLGFDAAEFTEAAKEMGLRKFSAKGLLASGQLGTAIKQVGAIKVGRAFVLMAVDSAQHAVAQCDAILDVSTDDKLKAQLVGFKAQLIKHQLEGGASLIKSAEVDESDDAKTQSPRAPGRGSQVPVIHAQTAHVSVSQSVNNPPNQ
jgi:hypothetical protein